MVELFDVIAAFEWGPWLRLGIGVVIAVAATLLLIVLVSQIARVTARKRDWPRALASGARHPFRFLIGATFLWIAITVTLPEPNWREGVNHFFLVATIALGAWLASRLITFFITLGMSRYRAFGPASILARKMQTQLAIVHRLAVVAVTIIAAASILLTFPGVQAIGTSLFASAGILSVVAGLAAQSTLANVFAGIQLAFSGAIRVDDVVIAEKEWGNIEEITLTYVVVRIWDDRRLVLPSTYFTTTPFENWTRSSTELFGSVELDLDWRVSPAAMRTQLAVILAATESWDGRASVLQVTEAIGGMIRVRILVTAADAGQLFDLRCFVREEMVEWVHTHDPAGMPRSRVQLVQEVARVQNTPTDAEHTDQGGMFTGTPEAEERASAFTQAIPIIWPEPEPEDALATPARKDLRHD